RVRGIGTRGRGTDPHLGVVAAARSPRQRYREGRAGSTGDGTKRGPGPATHFAVAESCPPEGTRSDRRGRCGRGRSAGCAAAAAHDAGARWSKIIDARLV